MALHVMWEGVGQSNRKRRGAVIGRRRQQLGLGLKKGPKSAGSPTQDRPLSTPEGTPLAQQREEAQRAAAVLEAIAQCVTRRDNHPIHPTTIMSTRTRPPSHDASEGKEER